MQAQEKFGAADSETDKLAAEEGTASHWVGSETLSSYQLPDTSVLTPASFVGQVAPNGIMVTEEMVEAAEVYVHYVLGVLQETGALSTLQVEHRVEVPSVHPTECWGTPDCSFYVATTNTLYVPDYKYGHRYVDVYEMWQLIAYAAGLVDKLQTENVNVVMVVAQPRAYNVGGSIHTWKVTGTDLRGYVNRLHMAAEDALSDSPSFKAGPHCLDCTAAYTCPKSQEAAAYAMDLSERCLPDLHALTPTALGVELHHCHQAAGALKNRIKALETQAEHTIRDGKSVANYAMEATVGRLGWDVSNEQVIAIGDNLFKKDLRKQDVVTPTQTIAKGVDSNVINAYASRKRTGFKLVDDTENAKRIFNTIGEITHE